MDRFLFHFSSVTSASREAARYGSAVGRVNGVERYADCDGIRNAARRAGSFANLDDTDIAIEYDDGTTLKAASCPPAVRINLADRIVVSVSKEFRPVVAFVNIPFDFPVNSTTARTVIKEVGVRGTPAPTALPPGSNTLTPTASASPTPTNTPTDTPTSTATETATATDENAPTATLTQIPEDTSTPVPTNTPTNTPTPTATTPAPICAITVRLFSTANYKVTWEIENTGNQDLRLYQMGVEFPDGASEYGKLKAVAFEDPIWTGGIPSPADIFEENWNQGGVSDRDLQVGSADRKLLALTFDKKGSGLQPYQLDLYLRSVDGTSCSVYETWVPGE